MTDRGRGGGRGGRGEYRGRGGGDRGNARGGGRGRGGTDNAWNNGGRGGAGYDATQGGRGGTGSDGTNRGRGPMGYDGFNRGGSIGRNTLRGNRSGLDSHSFDGPNRGGSIGRNSFRGRGMGLDGAGLDGLAHARGDGGGGFRGEGFRGGGTRGGVRGGRGNKEPPRVFRDGTFPQPDATVTELENAMIKGGLPSAMAANSSDFKLPPRPAYGAAGRPIVLFTNYFELKSIQADTTLYRYSVSFLVEKIPKPKKKRLIQLLLEMPLFATVRVASDWAQTLVATEKIKFYAQDSDKAKKGEASKKDEALVPAEGQASTNDGKLKEGEGRGHGDEASTSTVDPQKGNRPEESEPPEKVERTKFVVEWYPRDGQPIPPPSSTDTAQRTAARRKNTYIIEVEEIGTVSVRELLQDLAQPTSNYPLKLETIQALNVIMTYGPSSDMNIATTANNKFYPFNTHLQVQRADLGSGLEAYRGYFSSVRTSVNRILVNVNVATGAFYKAGSLLDILIEVNGGSPPKTHDQYRRAAAFVRKLRFETNYIRDTEAGSKSLLTTKRKVHTIGELSAHGKHSENVTFLERDANGGVTYPTVQAYFLRKHDIKLKNPAAPLVNYGTTDDPKWIPVELCTILPGQLARRLLLPFQTSAMIEFAARRPYLNAESITGDGLKVTKISPVTNGLNTNLSGFGIKVNPNMLTVPGRILDAPILQYRGQVTCVPANGSWNLDTTKLGKEPFHIAKKLGSWDTLVIECDRETIHRNSGGVAYHLELFRKTLITYGLAPDAVPKPMFINIPFADVRDKNLPVIQKKIFDALNRKDKTKPKFLFVLLPNDSAVIYDSVKFVCDCQLGIPNICSIGSKFSKEKGQMQYFANVAMKFNQKLGGINHTVKLKDMAPLDSQTILFGIDVTHPSPGSAVDAPSIAGVVASADFEFSQYPASMRQQESRKEMVTQLKEMIMERLDMWRERNAGLPNKVIVYRDGVSEGQYRTVIEEEYAAFKEAFDKMYGAVQNHPKISIIIVGKRHHTRFYPTKLQDTDGKTGNPKPGTVVDRGVTGEKLFDFFLLAHQGLQGTSRPAHYVVLKDDIKLGADQLQKLTHNLCYTFARATRSVSICPPAYYADLLCERGRSYLHGKLKGEVAAAFSGKEWEKDVAPTLMGTMYYL